MLFSINGNQGAKRSPNGAASKGQALCLLRVDGRHPTFTALGSDVMVSALAGYQFLKLAGKGEGLDAVNRDMGKRFDDNGGRTAQPQPVQA